MGGGGGGGPLILSYIRRLRSLFLFKSLNFNIFGVFRNGFEDFVDIILGTSQNWTIFRGRFYVF